MQYVHTVANHFCRVTGVNKCPRNEKKKYKRWRWRQWLHFTFDLAQMKNDDDDDEDEDDGRSCNSNSSNNEKAALIVATRQQAFGYRVPCILARGSSEQLKNT